MGFLAPLFLGALALGGSPLRSPRRHRTDKPLDSALREFPMIRQGRS
jgi:hypothetical protein